MGLISIQIPWNSVWNFVKNFFKKRVMLTTLALIIGGTIVFYFGVKPLQEKNEKLSLQVQDLSANIAQIIKPNESPSPQKCISGKFPDNADEWIIQQYNKPDEEGFYCPRLDSEFYSPDIWYRRSIPTKFESIEFRYKVKNTNQKRNPYPSFIFSFGKDPQIFRAYLPLESNPQLFGFEKITIVDSKYSLERESPKTLNKPVREEVENELKIRMIIEIEQGNKVTFYFNPVYISAIEEDAFSVEDKDSISYSFSLPNDPKPGSEFSESRIGFGTFKGSCVKPISYKFCY